MLAPALPLLALLAGDQAVAFSVSVPKAVVKLAELQIEFMFTDAFAMVLQGGFGAPTFDRTHAKDVTMSAWDTGLQFRGYFTGSSSEGGAFAGAAGQYIRSGEKSMELTVQVVGAGGIVGYKWAFDLGPFIDVNGGAFNMNAPFGGFKQSGHGREAGVYGLEEFLEYKSLQLKG